jgi:hypothetical protein
MTSEVIENTGESSFGEAQPKLYLIGSKPIYPLRHGRARLRRQEGLTSARQK